MFSRKSSKKHIPELGALEILKYIGPGFLVTVGFIDPGNWAANVAAGSYYGYSLLWIVTLSTLILIALQHNAAHLGIATGLCLPEASQKFLSAPATKEFLFAAYMLFSNSYKKLEIWIIGFVSLIGLSFVFELSLVEIGWDKALKGWVLPSVPIGSLPILMSILGSVVMPHNIFLHSEVIQSWQWNLEGEDVIKKQLKYEFTDTLTAMLAGWAINSAMIIVAASVFYASGTVVSELSQAQATLRPLIGS